MDKMKIYNRIPVFLQNAACSVEGFRIDKKRYGKLFNRALKASIERSTWTYEQMCDYRDTELRKIVEHCYETVPYYKKIFNEYGINYKSIRTIDDLQKLPVITKQTVKDNFQDFISSTANVKDMIKMSTSGTTGSPFKFYTTKQADALRWADVWRWNIMMGIDFKTWRAYFGGNKIVPIDRIEPPFYRYRCSSRQILFSSYHMSDMNLSSYITCLNEKKIKWIQGYPSSINLLAQYMLDNNISLLYNLDYITLGSENVQEAHKENIMKAFGIYPYQNYSQAECVAVFRERKDKRIFVSEDIAAVEFIENSFGQGQRIIGTTLTNYAMPLLRYDTNDLAICRETEQGREIISIDGRNEDYLVLHDGRKVGRLSPALKKMENIKEAQFVQKEKGKVIINVVRGKNYTEKDEQQLLNELKGYLGDKMIIKIDYMELLPRTSNGKIRFVISEITE